MLYAKPKKDALEIHERAVTKYNAAFEEMEALGGKLYQKRQDSVTLICEIERLINSIANSPKEFQTKIAAIQAEREKFRATQAYANEALGAAVGSGFGVAAGVAGGAAVASLAPSAAMWVATTFGTASTGTAISTLHGAIATKAALAWLGGGALSAGGAGVAGGQALLALAGPIGWGIAGGATAVSVLSLGFKNKKIADQAMAEAKKITIAGAELKESSAKIQDLIDKTTPLLHHLRKACARCQPLADSDYPSLPDEQRYQLGALVNNTLSLAELLNQTI